MKLQSRKIMTLSIMFFLIGLAHTSNYNYSKCSSTQILNTKTLACEACPTNTQPNFNQNIPNQCICQKGYYPTDNGACKQYFTGSSTTCGANQFIQAFNNNGSTSTPSGCSGCDSKAYMNINGTGCTPCLTAMFYNSTSKKCQCNDSTYTETSQGCFPSSYTSSLGLTLTSSNYYNQLKYLVPGCYYFNSSLSCSQLINLCIYSQLASTPECDFFTKANLTSILYTSTSNPYSVTASDKSLQFNLKLIYFLPEGNYIKEKSLKLGEILRCGLPQNTDLPIQIGNNIQISCNFNFNNLVAQMGSQTYKSYVYQLLIQGQNGAYYEVSTYINGNSQPVKRFFLEDTFTSTSSVNVLTSLKFSLTLSSDGSLVSPSLYVSYTQLSLQVGTGVTPASSQTQTISYIIQFTSSISGFWSVILPIFIVVNILVIIHSVVKTYIGYLNRKNPFLFFLNFIDIWSIWIFYFLLITTGYWFIFTKTTSTIYTFISHQSSLYVAFYIVFALMILFRVVSKLIEKSDKLDMQVFMINWEKSKFRNSWREIFIVNSLAEFCTFRTFSTFWLMLIMLFFLTGLGWQQQARQVISTQSTQIQYYYIMNNIFLYFLSSSVLLVIVIVFKILRRLTVLFWPYPFQDFVDYCAVSNISFFFMRKRSPEGFYIHASIPDKTQVTYKQINQAIKRGLNKTRSIANEITQEGNLKLYIVYVNRQLEEKFNQMLKREEDQSHNRHIKYATGSTVSLKPSPANIKHPFYFREEFIEKRLKPTLQQIGQRQGISRTKTAFQSFFNIPPIQLRSQKGLNANQVIFDEKLDIIKEVFPNGDQFQDLHTLMIIYLLWVVVTQSSPIAAFLTYICDQWILNQWIGSSYRKMLQRMTRVKEGFML